MARGIHDHRYRWVIERLIQARQDRCLSQTAVGVLLGKPQQYVSRYETGERRLDIFEFVDAARVLGVDGMKLVNWASSATDDNDRHALP